ncbi:MAG TPA: hypothetical protein DHV26_05715 [Cytophagales bacterium]|nr:hypothetical protein [Cytophagales bacterium]HRG11412.1 TlpA disulfide reductase family protein [Cyclobacteriaceae bacterium]
MRITYLIFFLGSCLSFQFTAGQSTIIIDNLSDNKFFGFFYGNEFNDLESSIKLRQKDLFGGYLSRYSIATDVPLVVVFTNGSAMNGSPVLLYPGDTCEVHDDGSGGYSFRNRINRNGDFEILDKMEQEYGFVLPGNLGLILSSRLDIMYIVDRVRSAYINRKMFIKNFEKAHLISNEYRIATEKLIHQKYAISLLFPFYLPQDSLGYNFENLPTEYYTILNDGIEGVFDDSQLHLNSYQLVLWNYCKFLSINSLNTSIEFVTMFQNATQHFSGKSREFLMFLVLKKYTGKGLPDFQQNAETFLREYPESDYREYLLRLIPNDLTNEMLKLANERLIAFNGTDITWKQIIDRNKGKVVYIDFWASWCKPCLQEMPYSASLRDSLKNKDVTFLYISLDRNKDSWIRASSKLNFDYSQHFLFKSESELKNLFALQAIPKYLIIDKEGNIYSPDAPRPSDPRLYNTLLKLSVE